jgi:hypothetical protein
MILHPKTARTVTQAFAKCGPAQPACPVRSQAICYESRECDARRIDRRRVVMGAGEMKRRLIFNGCLSADLSAWSERSRTRTRRRAIRSISEV